MGAREQLNEGASEFESPVVLLNVSPLQYHQGVLDALRYFSDRFGAGLYLTLNKPCSTLQAAFMKAGVSPEKLVFLDSITNTGEHETESCRYLGRMRELTDICVQMMKLAAERKVRFVLLDSVSTLLLYNDAKSVARFCHAVAEKLRSMGLSGALILVDMEEAKDMTAQLAQFCDAYVRVGS